jgi:hypothetical protein
MRFQEFLLVMFFLAVPEAGATPPPFHPNFCSHGICLEINQFFSERVKVTTVTSGLKTEVTVYYPSGIAKLAITNRPSNTCKTFGIRLQKSHGMYVGEGCVALPQPSSESRQVTLEYEPTEDRYSTDFPILHIWAIDSAPVSFWASGYALRIDGGQAVQLPESEEN